MDRVVGVLGGGQLGRMLLEAANRLNIRVHVLAEAEGAPATQVSAHAGHVTGAVTNPVAVKHLALGVDVLTVEIEHVDTEVLEEIANAGGGGDPDDAESAIVSGGGSGGGGGGRGSALGRRSSRQTRRESGNGNGKAPLMSGGLGVSGGGSGAPALTGAAAGGGGNGTGAARRRSNNGLGKTPTTTTITSTGASSSSGAGAGAGGSHPLPTPPRRTAVHPHWRTLRTIQDKFGQKAHLQTHGVPCARAVAVDAGTAATGGPAGAVERAVAYDLGSFPAVLKARTGAYDGRGNYVLKSRDDIPRGLDALRGRPLYVEEWADFVKELAVMVVKVDGRAAPPPPPAGEEGDGGGGNGAKPWAASTLAYPVVETVHEDGVCSVVYAPARDVDEKTRQRAQDVARRAVATFWGKGIFGVEMFLMPNGEILINEIAPRPHNSGHYTIEACGVSQYEAHLRAILDLPLSPADLVADRRAIMLNVLGGADRHTHLLLAQRALSVPRAAVHLYGKGDGRPGRKMGHVTVSAASMDQAQAHMEPLIALAAAIRLERLQPRSSSSDATSSGGQSGGAAASAAVAAAAALPRGGNGGGGGSQRERERDRRRSNEPSQAAGGHGPNPSALLQSLTRVQTRDTTTTTGSSSRYPPPPPLSANLSPATSPIIAPARPAGGPLGAPAPPVAAGAAAGAGDGPLVAVTMGSDSDLKTLQPGLELLRHFRVPVLTTICSAHRTPERMLTFAKTAAARGFRVIIAGAGGAAHLPGMMAASTHLPVIGVPVKTSSLEGLDSLLSIVQMPRGCPVATVGINNANNAAQLAVRILALTDEALRERLERYLADQTQSVVEKAERLETVGADKYH